jgi:hypothetical protein
MGLPVRFAAPDSQCESRGRVNSGMPVRIALQPEKPGDSPKVQAFRRVGLKSLHAFCFDGQSPIV